MLDWCLCLHRPDSVYAWLCTLCLLQSLAPLFWGLWTEKFGNPWSSLGSIFNFVTNRFLHHNKLLLSLSNYGICAYIQKFLVILIFTFKNVFSSRFLRYDCLKKEKTVVSDESWAMLGDSSAAFEGADNLGQCLSQHCDAFGLQRHPPEDVAPWMKTQSLSLDVWGCQLLVF